MYNQQYKKLFRKKRNHRAGKKTRASRTASHLRWLHRQALKSIPRIKSIENISLSLETFERLKLSAKSVFHFETSVNNPETDHHNNAEPSQPFLIDHLIPGTSKENNHKIDPIIEPQTPNNFVNVSINSSKSTSIQELDQNINFQRESVSNHEDSSPKDLIFQLQTQLPNDYIIIDQYASYLNFY